MNRRQFLQTAAAGSAAGQTATQQRPNILFICTDQQRWDTVASLGNSHIRTPNLDRLARTGVAFTHAYCQNPICTPSRASFMTGCYPSTIHVHRNGNSHFPIQIADRLLPRILKGAGYDCGLVGKLHLSGAQNRIEPRFDDGYRIFEWSHHPKPETFWPTEQHAYQRWLRDQGVDWGKAYRVKPIPAWAAEYQPGISERYHEVTWASQRTHAFLKGELKAPWFISLHCFAPHPPFDPAPEYLERVNTRELPEPLYRDGEDVMQQRFAKIDHQTRKPIGPAAYAARQMKAAYYGMIEHIDHELGKMLDALEQSGQRDNTIVVFTSDHGEMLGDHGLRQKGCRFYEGAVRVPLIISWPGKFSAGIRSSALVELTDIVPTLLESLGLAVPVHVQGKSLVKILRGEAPPDRHREFVRSEYQDTLDMPGHTHATMLRDERYKLVLYHGHGLGELYDLAEDRDEFRNLWDAETHGKLRARLTERLFDAMMLATDFGQPRVGRF